MTLNRAGTPRFLDASIQRPGRYIGLEWNRNPIPEHPELRVALCYPDIYEIGMSHPGLLILYHVLSNCRNVAVERFFSPWPDAEKAIRSRALTIGSIETGRPLDSFDTVFITMPHELLYTNILNILDLGNIPLNRSDRRSGHPVIIGGGIGTMNPEPLSLFFDAFAVGDGEETILDIVSVLAGLGGKSASRRELNSSLANLAGCYVPYFHAPPERPDDPPAVRKRVLTDLDTSPYPWPVLVPVCRPVQERVVVEAGRGCPRQCRFCQARVFYSPLRNRSPEKILEIVDRSLISSGYEEVSILSLNIADYPGIEVMIDTLMVQLRKNRTALSLPSLRPERLTPGLVRQIRSVRKTGFTLAPEAGTERLRRIIGKPYDTDQLFTGVESVFLAGWSLLKLYFMLGQPFEEDRDIEGIADLVLKIRDIARRIQGNKAELNISLSTFIPKAHTPFQWAGQALEPDLNRRLRFLRKKLNLPGIKLSFQDIRTSRLEALISRGDRRIGEVILNAFQSGCRFDAWREWMDTEKWIKAFETAGIDMNEEACRTLQVNGVLPWDGIDPLIPRQQLVQSYLCARDLAAVPGTPARGVVPVGRKPSPGTIPAIESVPDQPASRTYRYFGLYCVRGNYRFFKHLEISTTLIRAARRAGLPLEYSQGFNPRPRFSFAPPAPLGLELLAEPFEFRLYRPLAASQIKKALSGQLSADFNVIMIGKIPQGCDSILQRLGSATYAFRVSKSDKARFNRIFGTYFWICPETRHDDFIAQTDRSCYNLIFVFPANRKDVPRFRDILKEMFRQEFFPFDSVSGCRLCWNLDETGQVPLAMEFGGDG
ncbi:TIGR03960 family B12-binding radical SAM protein [bacterium]|nr:TIGR03960 family B12-binding radical SAM protein [candidate division CSSED10-310 bacterium]